MRLLILVLVLTCCLALAFGADARTERSRAQVNAFLRQQGLARTPPGYEVDHIMPLCAGGKDSPENMQLLTKEQHKAKTRDDLRLAFIYLVIEITSGYIEISAGISGYVDSNVSGKVSTDINRY